MLAIDGLTFSYPKSETGFAFDIVVAPGEIVGLTGPSGSGKSTLFDLIAGFLAPSGGDITLGGTSILPLPPERRPVSIVFQSDNVFDHLSAGTNVALGLGNHIKPDDSRVTAALDRMGLDGLGTRRAANLSGGQKQRVALARTLLRDRPVLLLDEPFTGLDAESATRVRQAILVLVNERNWHAIVVSHQSDDIAALCTRVYQLDQGKTRLVEHAQQLQP